MKRNFIFKLILPMLLFPCFLLGQNWKLKSKVELRNWKLSSKAYKQSTFLEGAVIELSTTSGVILATTTDKDGHFEMNIPSTGHYTLTITAEGYNSRMFSVNNKSVFVKNSETNSIPAVDMTGFISSKTIKAVGDLGLSQTNIQMFDENTKTLKYGGLNFSVNVKDAEYNVIQKFCTCNKLGDLAIEDKNYELAKTYYQMAMDVIPGEEYPKERLVKANEGLKMEDLKRRDSFRKPNTKSKPATSKPIVVAQPVKSADFKKPASSGKAGRKTLRTLGK